MASPIYCTYTRPLTVTLTSFAKCAAALRHRRFIYKLRRGCRFDSFDLLHPEPKSHADIYECVA